MAAGAVGGLASKKTSSSSTDRGVSQNGLKGPRVALLSTRAAVQIIMATVEERVSRLEVSSQCRATKEDIAVLRVEMMELRGRMRALRWLMSGVGVGLAALTLILKYPG